MAESLKSPWISAWTDPVAGLQLFSQLMLFCDLKDDGDHKFVVADHKQLKLKIYMGTSVLYIADLKSKPCAITYYYETNKKPCIPVIAVACETTIYYFKEFNAYQKFDLPPVEFSEKEQSIWHSLQLANEDSLNELTEQLYNYRESGQSVSCITTELLSIDDMSQQFDFIHSKRNMPLQHASFITCITRLNKQLDEEKAQQMLVVGTEQQQILFLGPNGTEVKHSMSLDAVPIAILCEGQFDVNYKCFAACRNGSVYIIVKGQVDGLIKIDSKPIGLTRLDKSIVVAAMDNSIQSFTLKGKKNFTVQLPSQIVAIVRMESSRGDANNNVLVACKNGDIRMYNGKSLVDTLKTNDQCNGIIFGIFGREEGCLVINTKTGAIHAKIIQRQAKLTVTGLKPAQPAEQDIPLKVPQKTTLFVELTQREREQSQEMHNQFQKDLCKLRYNTAKTYLGLLDDGVAPMAYAQGSQIRLQASYEGIGPVFKIKLQIQNLNKKPLINVQVCLQLNQLIYKLKDRNPVLPLLLPQMVYKVDIEIECLDPTGASDTIRVFVIDPQATVPLISANIQMPVSEVNFE